MALEETLEIRPIMAVVDNLSNVDILWPFETLILSQPHAPDDNEDEDEELAEEQDRNSQPIVGVMDTPYSQHLEDALAAEDIGTSLNL